MRASGREVFVERERKEGTSLFSRRPGKGVNKEWGGGRVHTSESLVVAL